MTDDFRTALQDLVVDVPQQVVPDDLADVAWATGRRRRRRGLLVRGLAACSITVALVAMVFMSASVLRPVTPADGGAGATVQGYPERIGPQWSVKDLPSAPGPLAGLLQSWGSGGDPETWYGFSPDGRRWRVPSVGHGLNDPTISPDGTQIAYLAGLRGPYVIQNLLTGMQTEFPSIGSATGVGHTSYQVEMQAPAFWSPDGQHLLVYAFTRGHPGASFIMLGTGGGVSAVAGSGYAAGWINDDELAFVPREYDRRHPVGLDITDLAGQPLRTVVLGSSEGKYDATSYSQWSPSVSPDGRLVMLRVGAQVTRFTTDTGRKFGAAENFEDASGGICPAAWQRDRPVLGTQTSTEQLTVIYPKLNPNCVVWASDALAGEPHGNLFGLADHWLAWWWREVLIVALGVLVLLALTVWSGRRVHRWHRQRGWPDDAAYQSLRTRTPE